MIIRWWRGRRIWKRGRKTRRRIGRKPICISNLPLKCGTLIFISSEVPESLQIFMSCINHLSAITRKSMPSHDATPPAKNTSFIHRVKTSSIIPGFLQPFKKKQTQDFALHCIQVCIRIDVIPLWAPKRSIQESYCLSFPVAWDIDYVVMSFRLEQDTPLAPPGAVWRELWCLSEAQYPTCMWHTHRATISRCC